LGVWLDVLCLETREESYGQYRVLIKIYQRAPQ